MSWEPELDELRRRTELAKAMGGPDKVARQHEFGKLTVRERVERLVDDGTFDEIGTVAGVGHVRRRGGAAWASRRRTSCAASPRSTAGPVVVSGDDFTVRGGSADASIGAKRNHAEGLALELRLPHIRLVDGMGGGGSVKTIEKVGRTPDLADARVGDDPGSPLGRPVGVARARIGGRHRRRPGHDEPLLGDREGHRADDDRRARARRLRDARAALRQERARRQPRPRHERRHRRRGRVRGRSVRAGSPLPVVPADVGGRAAAPCGRAPTTPSAAKTRCCRSCRATRVTSTRCARSSRRWSIATTDGTSSFFEIGRQWGKSIIGGLARFDGWPVALFAEDPYVYGGAWTASSSQKVTRAHRPRQHVPPAARPPRRLPGLPHRSAGRAGGARSATARARWPRSARARRRTARW